MTPQELIKLNQEIALEQNAILFITGAYTNCNAVATPYLYRAKSSAEVANMRRKAIGKNI